MAGGIVIAGLGSGLANARAIWTSHREHVLGTSLGLTIFGADAEGRIHAEAAALAEISRLDRVFSAWRDDSELAGLNRSSVFEASEDLYGVVAFAERMRTVSRGAFSARLGAVSALWRQAAAEDRIPSDDALNALSRAAEKAEVVVDPRRRRIVRPDAVRFDLDGVAKGYIIDRALNAARAAAPRSRGMLLDIGGDVRAWGEAPEGAWRAGVASGAEADNIAPSLRVRLVDQAIAVSGPGPRDAVIEGQSFAHFMAPESGQRRSGAHATVIANSAMEADALSTALALLPRAQGMRMIEAIPGAAARVVRRDGTVEESALWPVFAQGASQLCQGETPVAPNPWPAGFSVNVAYEIPRVDSGDYQRPNVSIWISDGDRRLVRTLLVLGARARWRESNYIWWRRFERMNLDAVQAIARPTRAPGRYSLAWDGRDDRGNPVGQGQYLLNIESSREHGGHSFTSIPLDLAGAPLTLSAGAQEEIGPVNVSYGARQ
ncbi:MAG: DUF2271 domain-containing protein [Terricaulis sp.]